MADPMWCSEKVKFLDYYKTKWNNIIDRELSWEHREVSEKLADIYVTSEKYEEFAGFLSACDNVVLRYIHASEKFTISVVKLRVQQEKLSDVQSLIKTGNFSPPNYKCLIDLWDQAHYQETCTQIRKPLTPLMRYRVRQRNPPPKSICPSGIRSSYKLAETAKDTLKDWLSENLDMPYPSKQERDNLSKKTGLSSLQIKTWFANRRRRLKINASQKESNNRISSTPENQLSFVEEFPPTFEAAQKYSDNCILPSVPWFVNQLRNASLPTSNILQGYDILESGCLEGKLESSPCSNRSNILTVPNDVNESSPEKTFTVLDKWSYPDRNNIGVNVIHPTYGTFDWRSRWQWDMYNPRQPRFFSSPLHMLSYTSAHHRRQQCYNIPGKPENYSTAVCNLSPSRPYTEAERYPDGSDLRMFPSYLSAYGSPKEQTTPASQGSMPQPFFWNPQKEVGNFAASKVTYSVNYRNAGYGSTNSDHVPESCLGGLNEIRNGERLPRHYEDEEAAQVLVDLSSQDIYQNSM